MTDKWYKLKKIDSDRYKLEPEGGFGSSQCSLRNIYSQLAFDSDEERLIVTDIKGNLYYFESLDSNAYYKKLGNVGQTTFIAFNPLTKCEIIAGLVSADIKVLRTDLSLDRFCLLSGHQVPPIQISFYKEHCLTCSPHEVIMWYLKSCNKSYQLRVNTAGAVIKKAKLSETGQVVVLYNNDTMQAWAFKHLENGIKINTKEFGLSTIKDFTFTKDGRAMIIVGVQSKIVILQTSDWNILKTFSLPESLIGIKHIHVVPVPLDGGANKIVAVISSNCTLRFIDLNCACLLKTSQLVHGVRKAVISNRGKYIAYIGKDGCLYLTYSEKLLCIRSEQTEKIKETYKPHTHTVADHLQCIRKNLKEELNLIRLVPILKEFGEYPEKYRMLIWSTVLKLPGNRKAYIALSNKANSEQYSLDILKDCSLANRSKASSLAMTVNCLTQWCPLLGQSRFLPKFVFPFLTVFQKDPLLAFELILSILLNFCQKWFEYHPLPPMNILGIIENVLLETDPNLVKVFCERGITSTQYAWPLLQTTMSEVLSAHEWLVLWDHLVSLNQPFLLLFCVIAYSICSRDIIISSLHSAEEFEQFYNTQAHVTAKDLLKVAEKLNKKVPYRLHPARYLRNEMIVLTSEGPYPPLSLGEYPKFLSEDVSLPHLMKLKEQERNTQEEGLKSMKLAEEKRLENEVQTFINDIQQDRLDEVRKCFHREMHNIGRTVQNAVEQQSLNRCACKGFLQPVTESLSNINTDNLKDIPPTRKSKKSINYERLKKDVEHLENEVQSFLSCLKSGRSECRPAVDC